MNARYRHFQQAHLTAGDEDQFLSMVFDPKLIESTSESVDTAYEQFENIVLPTFRYMFHKLKKGIFIHHSSNRQLFLPFNKVAYINDMTDRLIACQASSTGRNILPHIQWYCNNGIYRYDRVMSEYDYGMNVMKHMFDEFHRHYPNILFTCFINKRDFPIVGKNQTEPYDAWFHGEHIPLRTSFKPSDAVKILSMTTSENHDDIPIPTYEDWARSQSIEYGQFSNQTYWTHELVVQCSEIAWKDKIDCAIFRGSSTGLGTNPDTNPRLRVLELDSKFIDAGITKWNCRPRKHPNNEFVQELTPTHSTVPRMSYIEQAHYKYIINIPGHVTAFRLGDLLLTGSVILHVETPYKIWYEQYLQPYVHYIPIANNLSNLEDQIQWCINHENECEQIAKQAREFYNQYLTCEKQLKYLATILDKTYIPLPPQQPAYKRVDSIEHLLSPITYSFPIKFNSIHRIRSAYIINNTYLLKPYKKHENRHELYTSDIICDKYNLKGFRNSRGVIRFSGELYVAFPYIKGVSFFDILQRNPSETLVKNILKQCGHILHDAHIKCSFVHYDLAPWNIMVEFKDVSDDVCVTLIDYGKSSFIDVEGTSRGFIHCKGANEEFGRDMFTVCVHTMFILCKANRLKSLVIELYESIFNQPFDANVLNMYKKYDNCSILDIPGSLHSPDAYLQLDLFKRDRR